jgi:hypothetical protein
VKELLLLCLINKIIEVYTTEDRGFLTHITVDEIPLVIARQNEKLGLCIVPNYGEKSLIKKY